MTYRVQIKDGKRWHTVGLDCIDMSEVRSAIAYLARGAVYRVLAFGV